MISQILGRKCSDALPAFCIPFFLLRLLYLQSSYLCILLKYASRMSRAAMKDES